MSNYSETGAINDFDLAGVHHIVRHALDGPPNHAGRPG